MGRPKLLRGSAQNNYNLAFGKKKKKKGVYVYVGLESQRRLETPVLLVPLPS